MDQDFSDEETYIQKYLQVEKQKNNQPFAIFKCFP